MEIKELRFLGCKFYNRCPNAEDKYMGERPPAIIKAGGRDVYCHFAWDSHTPGCWLLLPMLNPDKMVIIEIVMDLYSGGIFYESRS